MRKVAGSSYPRSTLAMSESLTVRPRATIGVSRIFCNSSNAPSTRMKTSGPRVSIDPAGVTRFWVARAEKISCGETPSVARRSCEKATKIRSPCSPMMFTFLTPGTWSKRCRSDSA